MTGGAIVTAVGIALAVGASLDLAPSWNTAIVGVALVTAGALRRALGAARGDDAGATCASDRGPA